MGSTLEVALWVWMILDLALGSVLLPEVNDQKFIAQCVNEHNTARSSVRPPASNMLYMTWDEGLAITARAWAKQCVFEHNIHLKDARRMHPIFLSVGENIWAGYPPSLFNVSRAIKKWVDEKQDYNYRANTCTNVCGHYTQVVWASSYKVGCAAQLCPKGVANISTKEGVVFVCNYATAGNINGQQPYETQGAACSGCKDTCKDRLCHSTARDSQRSYNWTPDWDSSPAHASSYVTILIVRPVALIFTFITAYIVHYTYPNVFFYE
ncbi:glioma pathogenesis-related protein 1 [Mastacembelus armatus]|uniref:Cytidine monophospho-N-acetylneuraminic acid hydroxylase n=1 Tax=Mastacembelus armatus TaxID=205130 RepID=A0A3Q3NED6_9TELE|nr:glioma pathogenesis-related protein 1 [Mastacembelus armatus]